MFVFVVELTWFSLRGFDYVVPAALAGTELKISQVVEFDEEFANLQSDGEGIFAQEGIFVI
ncbi:MAG: hypothetical protein DMG64_03145 [Acidobacteria bacterium]|nr:MAG: hypothetical protein DMG64_03145 [Acidobacteriota bacterium]PYY22225.1 MAG: hypothetical protein DMG62_14750 [Acidobacteriota bacterium]